VTSKGEPFSKTDAVRVARAVWGIEAEAEPLPGELDRNFLLTMAAGERFVLKVSPAGADVEPFECQVRVLEFLAASPVAHLVPGIIPTADGHGMHPLVEGDEEPRWMRLVSHLDGTPLAGCRERPPELLQEIGRTLAKLDLILAGFDHPGARRTLPWDIEGTAELEVSAKYIPEAPQREMVQEQLQRFRKHVRPRLAGLPHGVIHNDANDHNLLVRNVAGGRPELVGLVDFGDMLHSITIAELAIACAYLMLDEEDPLTSAAHVVTGYHSARPLVGPEQELLFDLILARLCASVLISARNRHEEPDNEYLQISAQPVWRLLERMNGIDPRRATRVIKDVCMDPGSATGVFKDASRNPDASERSADEIVAIRRQHVGPNLSISYTEPLKIVRGHGPYLFDESGRQYLDLVNNVCHVGHCHPRVVAAAQRQMAELNTNTRYLHDHLVEYALRLTSLFPDPLSVCYFVNSGTEANDLALRLARSHTGSREIIVLDHAYHGHSPSLIEISPYKCEGRGGEGLAEHVHKVSMPDPYRGPHRGPDAGKRYAGEVRMVLEEIGQSGTKVGAFMAESLIGCGGQVIPAGRFLTAAHDLVRSAGGVCIADEVQVGFGRVGSHYWAFETQDVVPDIVTLGKPIGNGHPMAAVITTPEIAASFDTGMEYFNTFGGNPVSCAVGLAVLDVIEQEGLQRHALEMGNLFLDGLKELQARHQLMGDVRGLGLFIGVELVRDPETLEPAGPEASLVIDEMRRRGFLLSTDGPLHNVIKIKPPLAIQSVDIEETVAALDEVLAFRFSPG
jgi:4-aminobutyrate aminotransferase-like enzyme/Ser/Thr protein kinase RdoA (MazF antagonist)